MSDTTDISQLVSRLGREGDTTEALISVLYKELRALAATFLASQRPDHTLQPTALVHEACLRLLGGQQIPWEGRAHFFSVAAMAMRQVLVNHAKARGAIKRGGELQRVTLCDASAASEARDVDLIALDESLDELQKLDERQARIVEMRYFAGLCVDEVAHVLGVSPSTVEKDWRMARLWLLRRLTA